MLRNHLFIHLNAGPNLEVGVMLNGTFVGIDGAVPHGDPPVIELILDPDALYKALDRGSPDQLPAEGDRHS